jgi:pimeloyl-ACP methyl ester carboxylesterase
MKNNSIYLLLIAITISFTILLSNNISFFSSYSQNTTTSKTTAAINNLNLSNLPTKIVPVDDINIGYKQNGTGPPILLITGFSASMNNWDLTLVSNLSKNHNVTMFDNRGIGSTTNGTKNFTIHQFAQDTIGLMNALHINKTDIMGFSMGSYIAQDIALTNPEKINKLVLYAPVCGGPESTPLHENLTKITLNSKNATEFYRGLIPLIFPKELIGNNQNVINNIANKFPWNTPMDTIRNQFSALYSWNYKGVCDQIKNINSPTLIMVGTKDILNPPPNSLMMAEKIPDSWLIRIQGGGHAVMPQNASKIATVIDAFLHK